MDDHQAEHDPLVAPVSMHGKEIRVPGGMTKTAVEAAPMALADVAAAEDWFGAKAAAGKDPATGNLSKGQEGWRGEDPDKRL